MAYAALICGIFITLGFAAAYPERLIWPAILSLAVLLLMLRLVGESRKPSAGLLYLAVGAVATFAYTYTFATQLPEVILMAVLWLAPPKIALVLVAGAGTGLVRALAWTMSGYLIAELSSLFALQLAGLPPIIDFLTLAILAEVVAVCLLAFFSSRNASRTHPQLQRAARDELLDDIRARMELRAAALMHDTILSHLAAIASSSDGALTASQKEHIERDLKILVGQEWLSGGEQGATADGTDERASPLRQAISEVRADGLEVIGTGDFASVMRLSPEQATALGLAAKQCLVNVIKHSGVMKAEVAVYASADEVSVMIIDAGRGFSDSAVGSDRLGLRASVQDRIQSEGGMVQVWSTPGAGTSILIQLPIGSNPDAADRSQHGSGQHPVVSGPLPTIDDPSDSYGPSGSQP
jgi:signal transduction histidine kinase